MPTDGRGRSTSIAWTARCGSDRSTSRRASDFEKLGLFYLGREIDPVTKARQDTPLLYDSSDLVTHAVIAGMTGSGKTGLGIDLIEEAAIDGVPVIAIDPKGDLGNLLLTFPQLAAADFAPWVDADEARRAGQTPDAFAAAEAAKWSKGLAEWGQDGARIERLRDAAEFALYTPGSTSGRPLSIVKSFAAPDPEIMNDAELLHDRVATAATSVLTLAGVDAEPMRSREHTLLVHAVHRELAGRTRSRSRHPDHADSIAADHQGRRGRSRIVLPVQGSLRAGDAAESAAGRARLQRLARRRSPSTSTGCSTATSGRPRVSIISIAHLDDQERMFFVSLLLNEIVGWMRSQRGTSSLRALIYFDEIFGFLPPVANPPSKAPLMTMLKQARAFGLGVVVATQNPVDLDYKALGNAGTWMLGRLQTERDKARVLDGLDGAAAAAGSRLRSRPAWIGCCRPSASASSCCTTCTNSEPVVFETRWTLSYLRGPLGTGRGQASLGGSQGASKLCVLPRLHGPQAPAHAAPPLARPRDPAIVCSWLERLRADGARRRARSPTPTRSSDSTTPKTVARRHADYRRPGGRRLGPRRNRRLHGRLPVEGAADGCDVCRCARTPQRKPGTTRPGKRTSRSGSRSRNRSSFQERRGQKLISHPDESERDFRIRLQDEAREARDAAVAKVRDKYASKMTWPSRIGFAAPNRPCRCRANRRPAPRWERPCRLGRRSSGRCSAARR